MLACTGADGDKHDGSTVRGTKRSHEEVTSEYGLFSSPRLLVAAANDLSPPTGLGVEQASTVRPRDFTEDPNKLLVDELLVDGLASRWMAAWMNEAQSRSIARAKQAVDGSLCGRLDVSGIMDDEEDVLVVLTWYNMFDRPCFQGCLGPATLPGDSTWRAAAVQHLVEAEAGNEVWQGGRDNPDVLSYVSVALSNDRLITYR